MDVSTLLQGMSRGEHERLLIIEKWNWSSDQIITWVNAKSENENDGHTLLQFLRLVTEKAIDDPAASEMYARLCRKMMERLSPKVQDDGVRTNSKGEPMAGGQLFRKYLLDWCQNKFETDLIYFTPATQPVSSLADGREVDTRQKATRRRQRIGLVKLIGELFKLQMLTERRMHECIKGLLDAIEEAPAQEDTIESLTELLTIIGALLDTPKARDHMDIYFSLLKGFTKTRKLSSRTLSLVLDLLNLRSRDWVPQHTVAAPLTMASSTATQAEGHSPIRDGTATDSPRSAVGAMSPHGMLVDLTGPP